MHSRDAEYRSLSSCLPLILTATALISSCATPTYDFEDESRQWRNISLRPASNGPYLVVDVGVALLLIAEADCSFYFQRLQALQPASYRDSQVALVRDSLLDLDPKAPSLDGRYLNIESSPEDLDHMAARLLQWGKASVYHKTTRQYISTVTVMRWRTGNMGGRRFETVDTGEFLFRTLDYVID